MTLIFAWLWKYLMININKTWRSVGMLCLSFPFITSCIVLLYINHSNKKIGTFSTMSDSRRADGWNDRSENIHTCKHSYRFKWNIFSQFEILSILSIINLSGYLLNMLIHQEIRTFTRNILIHMWLPRVCKSLLAGLTSFDIFFLIIAVSLIVTVLTFPISHYMKSIGI